QNLEIAGTNRGSLRDGIRVRIGNERGRPSVGRHLSAELDAACAPAPAVLVAEEPAERVAGRQAGRKEDGFLKLRPEDRSADLQLLLEQPLIEHAVDRNCPLRLEPRVSVERSEPAAEAFV